MAVISEKNSVKCYVATCLRYIMLKTFVKCSNIGRFPGYDGGCTTFYYLIFLFFAPMNFAPMATTIEITHP